MFTGIILFFGISLLIIVHELGHFFAARKSGVRVEEFGFGFPPRMFSWRPKGSETLYTFNWLPFGGFVRLYGENKHKAEEDSVAAGVPLNTGRAFFAKTAWQRFVIIAAGVAINFIAGWILLSIVFAVGDRPRVEFTEILPESPAARAGVLIGDELSDFKTADEFIAFTRAHKGERVTFAISRNGVEQEVQAELRDVVLPGEGVFGAAVSDRGFERLPVHQAIIKGFTESTQMLADIFSALGGLVYGLVVSADIPEDIVGPVGVFGMAGEIGRLGFVYVIQVLAMISLNLAALNALPIPALDGGRILFLVIERVRGRALDAKRELWANLICFGFLLLLMAVITGRDIFRLFS